MRTSKDGEASENTENLMDSNKEGERSRDIILFSSLISPFCSAVSSRSVDIPN